jgi:hypothetical protein
LRYTVVLVLPSSLRWTLTSRNGIDPSVSGSLVNLMFSSWELIWSVNSAI